MTGSARDLCGVRRVASQPLREPLRDGRYGWPRDTRSPSSSPRGSRRSVVHSQRGRSLRGCRRTLCVFWAGVFNTAHNGMPLEFARFPLDNNPSGLLGSDGKLYVIASGQSLALATLSPDLLVDLTTVGGSGSGFTWTSVVWILGRAYTFAPGLHPIQIVTVIVKASKLGHITDALLERAREKALMQPRRPAQLRAMFRRLAADIPSSQLAIGPDDVLVIGTLLPIEVVETETADATVTPLLAGAKPTYPYRSGAHRG